MKAILTLAAGAAFVAAVLYGLFHLLGAIGLVVGTPLLGVLLARPLVELVTGSPRFLRRMVLRKVEGRYFEYRGMSLDIHVDAQAWCWISTHDLRKLVALPADGVLQRLVPLHCGETGEPLQWRITVEGLAQVLAKAKEPDVTKFCRWLEVDVARPARRRLERGAAVR